MASTICCENDYDVCRVSQLYIDRTSRCTDRPLATKRCAHTIPPNFCLEDQTIMFKCCDETVISRSFVGDGVRTCSRGEDERMVFVRCADIGLGEFHFNFFVIPLVVFLVVAACCWNYRRRRAGDAAAARAFQLPDPTSTDNRQRHPSHSSSLEIDTFSRVGPGWVVGSLPPSLPPHPPPLDSFDRRPDSLSPFLPPVSRQDAPFSAPPSMAASPPPYFEADSTAADGNVSYRSPPTDLEDAPPSYEEAIKIRT